MRLKNRLTKLEVPIQERWREAWQGYYDFIGESLGELTESLSRAAQDAPAARNERDAERLTTSFAERLGIHNAAAWSAWAFLHGPDADGPPVLSTWPGSLPDPPIERLGELETLEQVQAEDDTERFYLLVLRFAMGHARAHRAYKVRR